MLGSCAMGSCGTGRNEAATVYLSNQVSQHKAHEAGACLGQQGPGFECVAVSDVRGLDSVVHQSVDNCVEPVDINLGGLGLWLWQGHCLCPTDAITAGMRDKRVSVEGWQVLQIP